MVFNRTQSIGHAQAAADSVYYADAGTRIAFLRKVYTLLSAAMIVWMGTTLLVTFTPSLLEYSLGLMSGGFLGFILLMGVMFLLLRLTATAGTGMSLLGLGLFGVLEGFLTAPLVYIATATTSKQEIVIDNGRAVIDASMLLSTNSVVLQAFALTCAVFGGLTFYALTTKRDFLWMRGALYMGFFALMAIIVLSFFGVGENLVQGWGISAAFVALMGGFVLYDTQNIMKRYPEHMAAAAAATLLIDFIIMFKHILMLLMRRD